MVIDVVPGRSSRLRPLVGRKTVAFGSFLVGCLVAVLLLSLRPAPPANTPVRAVDLYVSAREQGDRSAMANILVGNSGLRASKLSEVDGRPVQVTGVDITRSSISNVLYDVTVTWTDASHPGSTDRLIVLPKSGDPSTSPEWSVSVAP